MASFTEMIARIAHGPEDDPIVRALRGAASIGETFFFRSPQQLQRLEEVAQTHLIQPKRRQGNLNLRVWSVACSTGEEAYTLAILFKRAAPDFNIQVVGSDMNETALQAARVGVYRSRAFRQVSPEILARWFPPVEGGWEVDEELRSCVSFKLLNLVADRSPAAQRNLSGFDVLVYRNVLIYLDADQIPGVMERLGKCSNATSVLVLTPAELAAARHAPEFKSLSSGLFLRSPATAQAKTKVRNELAPTPIHAAAASRASAHPARDANPFVDVAEALRRAREAADGGEFVLAEEQLALVLRRGVELTPTASQAGERNSSSSCR